MTAVVEQRNRLQALSRRFVEQATRFLGQELDHIADGPLNCAAALTGLFDCSSLQQLLCIDVAALTMQWLSRDCSTSAN